MSWLDELLDQVGQNGADAVPSEPQTDTTFNPGKDSQAASSLFSDLFKPEPSDTTAAGPYLGAAKDSQAANAALGLEPDYRIPSVAGFVSEQKDPGLIAGILKNLAIKKTSDGSIDYSDPKTIDTLMKLVMSGGSLVSAMMNRGKPQNYQSPAQLQASLKSPENNWTPQQQATANAFFNTPMQGGQNRSRIYAADMQSPIVPGKGYASGGVIPPAPGAGGYTWQGGKWSPLASSTTPGPTPSYGSQDVSNWLTGTGGKGISGSQGMGALETASFNNTGHYLSPQDFGTYGGQIEGGMDPTQLATSLGWSQPQNLAGGPGAAPYLPQQAQPAAANPRMGLGPRPGAPVNGLFPGQMPTAGGITRQDLQAAQRDPSSIDPNSQLAQYVAMSHGGAPQFDMAQAMRGVFGGQNQGQHDGQQPNMPPHSVPPNASMSPSGQPMSAPVAGPMMTTPIVPFSSQSASFSAYPGAGYAMGGPIMGGAQQPTGALGSGGLPNPVTTPQPGMQIGPSQPMYDPGPQGGQPIANPGQPMYDPGPQRPAFGAGSNGGANNRFAPTHPFGGNPGAGGSFPGPNMPGRMPGSPPYQGGQSRMPGMARGGALGHVMAATGGQDDVVPIRAAGGEYMMDADTVSALGDGNNAAGAKKLDAMRENIRAHKRSAPPNKIPPKAKPIGQYMKGGK